MTAYPTPEVTRAVEDNLFTCNDARSWIKKPIKLADVEPIIEKFLVQNYRIDRHMRVALKLRLIGKAAGRGKRAPKVAGNAVNISIGGACVGQRLHENEEE